MATHARGLATADPKVRRPDRAFFYFCILFISILLAANAEAIYLLIPDTDNKRFAHAISLTNAIIAFCGILFAVHSFNRNAKNTRNQQKKQHTITVLFESRLSTELRQAKAAREKIFRPGSDIDAEDWQMAFSRKKTHPGMAPSKVEERHEAADALLTLLNYHEFLALGIRQDDLEEELLKGSIRGIMCALVCDSRDVIYQLRKQNAKTYQHLSGLYDDWHDPTILRRDGSLKEAPLKPL